MHDAREYDAVVASGEQVTAGLLAIVLQDMGFRRAPGRAGRCRSAPTASMARRASHEIDAGDLASGWSRARSR